MNIVFISNYLTHHQLPLCQALYERLGNSFAFIETEEMSEERIKMKWQFDGNYPFLRRITALDELQEIVDACEVLIIGSIVDRLSLENRCRRNAITFVYSERRAKESALQLLSPHAHMLVYENYGRYRFQNFFLLCAGAYVGLDYHILGAFHGRSLKWGYFPQLMSYNPEKLFQRKKQASILWAGRFIDWKHPEATVEIAKYLKKRGVDFTMKMIGIGPMENRINQMIQEEKLGDNVKLLGVKTPEEVRAYMEETSIFIFTSDRNEGWGAVLNEAMNSGCAVVASNKIGAVPYLIQHGWNGYVFPSKKWKQLARFVERLCSDSDLCNRIGENAYNTIKNEWNAERAAERLIRIVETASNGSDPMDIFDEGICSRDKRFF